MSGEEAGGRPLTGRKVAVIAVGAFSVIIAVNLVLAWQAVRSFPGLEARNGFVESQDFDARRAAQQALGWQVGLEYADGELTLRFHDTAGHPLSPAALDVLVGRVADASQDRRPEMHGHAGHFSAPLVLEPGRWMVKVEARAADGTRFSQRLALQVRG